jgi:hypothetical protein
MGNADYITITLIFEIKNKTNRYVDILLINYDIL